MNLGDYNYSQWTIGLVKATRQAWDDVLNGTTWIRHYANITIFRGCTEAYVTVYSNVSQSDRVWGSTLIDFTTGVEQGPSPYDTCDQGLTIATQNWIVSNFSTLAGGVTNWKNVADQMASSEINTYDPGQYNSLQYASFTYSHLTSAYNLGMYAIGISYAFYTHGLLSTLIPQSQYNIMPGESDMFVLNTTGLTISDGDQLQVYFFPKLYQADDHLYVIAKQANSSYIVAYDRDNSITNTTYTDPQAAALLFPQPVAASNMVVEFWQDIENGVATYLANVSFNYNTWWWNNETNSSKGLSADQLHGIQASTFDFVASYMNDTITPQNQTAQLLASLQNPATITCSEEPAIPPFITINSPASGQIYNLVPGILGLPVSPSITLNVTFGGDTVYRSFYQIGSSGAQVQLPPATQSLDLMLNTSNYSGESGSGRLTIFLISQDTNGTNTTAERTVIITKSWTQLLSSTYVGPEIYILVAAVAVVAVVAILLVIRNKKKRQMPKRDQEKNE
jgi:hypothetical protein